MRFSGSGRRARAKINFHGLRASLNVHGLRASLNSDARYFQFCTAFLTWHLNIRRHCAQKLLLQPCNLRSHFITRVTLSRSKAAFRFEEPFFYEKFLVNYKIARMMFWCFGIWVKVLQIYRWGINTWDCILMSEICRLKISRWSVSKGNCEVEYLKWWFENAIFWIEIRISNFWNLIQESGFHEIHERWKVCVNVLIFVLEYWGSTIVYDFF